MLLSRFNKFIMSEKNTDMTLVDMLTRNKQQFPDKDALIYRGIKLSYSELHNMVNSVAHALRELGLKKGDRVGLMLPRIPELVISFLAIAKSQGIVVPINFELFDDKIRDILINTSPRFLIVHKQFLEIAERSIPPDLRIITVVVDGENMRGYSWKDLLLGRGLHEPLPDTNKNDVVYLNYTSGSTGKPKGAVTTHANIYWNTFAAVEALGLTGEDVHLCMFAPFAHPHEIFARPLFLGGTMVLVDTIYPKSIAEAIAKHQVTCMMGLAPMYETLLDLLKHKIYNLGSLRIPESGGMYTRTELIERFRQKLGVSIIPVWGSTETTGIAIAHDPKEPIIPGSVGKPCPSYTIKIMDENGDELPPGEIGEMIFKGPAVVNGYYQNITNGNTGCSNGWYFSGDLGKRDKEGHFYFIERKTGMMKVAGLKVYPLEIELVLLEHPDIQEAAVVPAKDRLRSVYPNIKCPEL